MKSNAAVSARPEAGEYAPYYEKYVSLILEDDILAVLERPSQSIAGFLATRTEADGDFRYAPGKWSVKEVLGHVIDSERVFTYRALRIARNDRTPMEGFEQDDYVKFGPFAHRSLAALVEEFKYVRLATLSLFRGLDEAAWVRRGIANKNEVSVRGIAYIIAGHELHHQKILQEKYFSQARA
jgi:DinB family protein